MELDQAIRTAIEYEAGVHRTYQEAMQRATDQRGRRFFEVLRDEEMSHLKYLRERLEELEAKAVSAVRRKRWPKAIEIYEELYLIAPDRHEYLYELARAHLSADRLLEGFTLLEKYASVDPSGKRASSSGRATVFPVSLTIDVASYHPRPGSSSSGTFAFIPTPTTTTPSPR